ncbi:MAG TPA: hypothetical protein VGJ77_08815, partial [Gaiellaceae bacterium]
MPLVYRPLGRAEEARTIIRRLAALPIALAAAAFAAAPAAAADQWVALYSWGISPSRLVVDPGDSVHFTNFSGQERRIVDADGLLDSGPLPPAGAYSVAVTVPGEHSYTATGIFGGAPTGTFRVRLTQLTGPPGAPAAGRIPDLPFPASEESDIGVHPDLTIYASRTRILLELAEGATVAQANGALAAAGVEIRGGLPELGLLLVAVPDNGSFAPLDAALQSLNASPAVAAAALSPQLSDDVIPKTAEANVESFVGSHGAAPWRWEALNTSWTAPDGSGGNWGLESSRFPEAWNLLDAIRERQKRDPASRVRTAIVDAGFDLPHPDLGTLDGTPLCTGVAPARRCTWS